MDDLTDRHPDAFRDILRRRSLISGDVGVHRDVRIVWNAIVLLDLPVVDHDNLPLGCPHEDSKYRPSRPSGLRFRLGTGFPSAERKAGGLPFEHYLTCASIGLPVAALTSRFVANYVGSVSPDGDDIGWD
ncbi:hypothetical protein [Kitasatospora xanthocidica]|uniref:hypothetical protein n=1 Tax=Kitasatospora xanthocidica TaxID=83382 RepID=UPI0015F31E92|nr:hypothetical protein [Kitasatospora xanthocidica]